MVKAEPWRNERLVLAIGVSDTADEEDPEFTFELHVRLIVTLTGAGASWEGGHLTIQY